MSTDAKTHWNRVYTDRAIEKLGWYEPAPEVSLEMIRSCGIAKSDRILDAGSGATTLIDHLLAEGYESITAVDISGEALARLRERLGPERASRVQWIEDDLTAPQKVSQLRNIALWHDRAVLHFLVEEKDRATYRDTLRKVLRPGGYAIIAAFALSGAKKCSGLPVYNYDAAMLAIFLGSEFELKHHRNHLYITPSGDRRPYVYTLFRRKSH